MAAHFDTLSLATLFTSAAILALGIAVAVRGRDARIAQLFFLITVGASGWLALFGWMYAAASDAQALTLARTALVFAAIIPAAVFHFSAAYTGGAPRLRKTIVACWFFCALVAAGALTHPFFTPRMSHHGWGVYPVAPPPAFIWMLVWLGMFAASVRMLARAARTDDRLARARAKALVRAFSVGSIAFVDVLPAIGLPIPPFGFIAILAFVALVADTMWRYELVQITPQFASAQVLETMKGAVLVVDLQARIRVANRAACTMLGYAAETDLVGRPLRTIIDPTENISTGQLLHSMGVLEQNMAWQAANGTRIDVLASSSFIRDAEGTPVGVVYVATDVTERRRAEQALRESEHRYRTLFDGNPLPMWVYDFETLHFVAVNDAAIRHYGYSRDAFLRMRITDIRPPEDVPLMQAALGELRERTMPRLFRHKKKDGTIFYVEITSFEFVSAGRRARLVIAVDVTERRRNEQLLRESEERYRSLVELSPDAIMLHTDGRFIFVNRATLKLLGASSPDELIGTPVIDRVHPLWRDKVRHRFTELYDGGDVPMIEEKLMRLDGSIVDVEVAAVGFTFNGMPTIQVVARDISERKEIEVRYRLLFERNLAGVFRTTVDGRILDCNDALARIFGYASRDELLSQSARSFYFDENERDQVVDLLRENGTLSNHEIRMRRADGRPVWVLENVTLLERGELEGTIIDITERKVAQEQIEYQAFHDVLTGLPNRRLFRDRMSVALAHARRQRGGVAVMYLDLDQVKLINDSLGHTAGDTLLLTVAQRLVACVRAEDTVARMGGDEFTILVTQVCDRRGAETVAQKVLEAVAEPMNIDTHELFVTTSIGIAIYPDDGTDAEMLLQNADRAMYRAKEAGRNNYQYATPAAFDATGGRLSIESSLHHAFEREEFVVHYQPMVDIASGEMIGAEALVRWRHPQFGLMMPDDFIPIAEECGLIVPIGEWVLRTACRQMKLWHDAGYEHLRIAVNLSPRQFQQRDLVATIERTLAETQLRPESLDLEITESTAMQNAELSLGIMQRLKEMGVRISIDDFGTGYSSLSYLKRFPIDTVKIDQNFVRDLSDKSNDGAIISAVISMARVLKLAVIAEGVENQEQLDFLQRERCETIQGFLFSKPVPAEELEAALKIRA